MNPKNGISIIRSSAAEYLTFVAGSGNSDVNAVYAEEKVYVSSYPKFSGNCRRRLQSKLGTGSPIPQMGKYDHRVVHYQRLCHG